MRHVLYLLCAMCGFCSTAHAYEKLDQVDLALVLAVDSSKSVNQDRWELQKHGYIQVFRSTELVRAVSRGLLGAIEVTVVHWSGPFEQRQAVPWHRIHDAATSERFASAIAEGGRSFNDGTYIAGAIDFCTRLLQPKATTALRRIIDVSGDETGFDWRSSARARDDAVRQGIVINGLPILGVDVYVEDHYRRRVVGGPGSFVVVARSYQDFAIAVKKKILLEIASSTVPK